MCSCAGSINFEPVDLNDGSRLYTVQDGIEALKIIYKKYGYETAYWVEQVYDHETSTNSIKKKKAGIQGVFTSGQYEHTGTPGMEAPSGKIAPYYGWGSFKKFEEDYPNYKMIGIYSAMEGKGMSGQGGNEQDTKNPKRFIKMNSVLGAMEFLIYTVKIRGGDVGSWHALSGPTKINYENIIKKSDAVYTLRIKNGEL